MSLITGRIRLAGRDALPPAMAAKVRVTCDGDRIRGVVAFDTWQGWVDYHRRDDRGHLVMLAGAAQLERRHGRVEASIRTTVLGLDVGR